MAALVEVDRERVARQIAEACAGVPAVAAALLFGSALGRFRPDSDIDVGAVRRPVPGEDADAGFRAGLRLEYELLRMLREYDGHPFDVVVLDPAQPLFVMTVLTAGRVAFVGDEDAYTDFLERVALRYGEDAPRYRRALDEVLEEPIP